MNNSSKKFDHFDNEEIVKNGFWEKLKGVGREIPFLEDAIAAYYCAFDEKTPLKVRVILLSALAYFILPVDMVPDWIAGLGYTDDLAVFSTALASIKGALKPEHKEAARRALEESV